MSKDLVIYGAGGFGREVRMLIDQINAVTPVWNVVGFVDDGLTVGTIIDDLPVLGDKNYLLRHVHPPAVVLAIADSTIRKRMVEHLKDKPIDFPTLIHPHANPGDVKRNRLGRGVIIANGTLMTTGITIGDFVILNLSCTVGHDVILEDYCSVMPGCHISGNVVLGHGSLIGTGARILQNLTIGEMAVIGAGAVVTRTVESHSTVVGIPAKKRQIP